MNAVARAVLYLFGMVLGALISIGVVVGILNNLSIAYHITPFGIYLCMASGAWLGAIVVNEHYANRR